MINKSKTNITYNFTYKKKKEKQQKCSNLWGKQRHRDACHVAIQLWFLGTDKNALFDPENVGILFSSNDRKLITGH